MFKALFSFPWFFCVSLLFFSPSVFSWNNTCYSPVQMAALLSKPKKGKKTGTAGMKKSISRLERAIERLEDRINEEQGNLGQSLDKKKLNVKSSSSVAGQIRSYIESKQDGWDCDFDEVSAVLKEPPLLFQSSLLFEILGQAFIPFAVGDETEIKILIEANDNGGAGLTVGEGDPCLSKGGRLIGETCTCLHDQKPIGNREKCCEEGEVIINGECVRGEAIDCKADESFDDRAGGCVKRCSSVQGPWNASKGKCCEKGEVIINGECVRGEAIDCKADESFDDRAGGCVKRCSSVQGPWNASEEKCCEKGEVIINGKCVRIDCEADESFNVGVGGCVKRCNRGQGPWNASKGKCCEKGEVIINGECVRGEAIDCKADESFDDRAGGCVKRCSSVQGPWNASEEKCCEKGEVIINGKCVRGEAIDCKADESFDDRAGGCVKRCSSVQGPWNASEEKCCEKGEKLGANNKCVKTKKTKCREGGGDFRDGKCKCPSGKMWKNGKCDCPEWKKHPAFGSNGRVNKSFCEDYARDGSERQCKKALSRMKNLLRRLAELEKKKEKMEDALHNAEISSLSESEKKTEAGGLCFSCLKRVLNASRPSTGQQIGNMFNILAGGALGYAGYRLGRRAQVDANMLRIQDGYVPQVDYYSLMGASAGYPYLARGFHGMTRNNTPRGGWVCSPTVSPWGHRHNYQHGQGFNMMYY